jgi:RNA polymerase sigma-70 factor (ECF subfamily)
MSVPPSVLRSTARSPLALAPTPATRTTLATATIAGASDDDRLGQLYRRHGAAIFARCRRLLRDDAAAEDAAQEVFCRVQRHLARVPEASNALPWLFRVASNYCLNQLRDGRRRRQVPLFEEPAAPASDLAEQTHARRLIAGVPEKLRAVAWLHHVEGHDQQEVADLVGVSRRTVLYRLADFQVAMRAHLAQTG